MSTTPAPAPPAADADIELSGVVSYLFCQRPEFCAGRLTVDHRPVNFAVRAYVKTGQAVTLRGRWTTHPKYGRQFQAKAVVYDLPANPAGLAQWLTWHGPGLGPVKAQQLVDEFGMDLPRLLAADPGQVAAAGRLPVECVRRVAGVWHEHAGRAAAASELAAWGLTRRQTEALLAKYKEGVVQLIRDDPYAVLGRVDGFGWATTDGLAARVGVIGDDPRRLRGAVAAAVREQTDKGWTCVPAGVAVGLAADKIGGDPDTADRVEAHIAQTVAAGYLVRVTADGPAARGPDGKYPPPGPAWLATPSAFRDERTIWRALQTARDPNPQFPAARYVDARPGTDRQRDLLTAYLGRAYGEVDGKVLDPGQLAAVVCAATHRVVAVTGGAGAGKTLVARAVAKLFADGDVPVMLCAPTGKAADRLREVTGRDAGTIHRLLEYSGKDGGFARNRDNPLPGGVVLLDEASMVDSDLGASLMEALGPDTALVLIGDPNQLPPVGAGALLRDVLAHGLAPVARLERCHRQAGTLKRNCSRLLDGVVEPWAADEDPSPWVVGKKAATPAAVEKLLGDLYREHLPAWGFDPVTDAQFLTAKHEGAFGTRRLNLVLQRLHQAALGNDLGPPAADEHERRPPVYVGDKVIHTKNDYTLNVMNGTIGVVRETKPDLVVEYAHTTANYGDKDGQVDLAYCLTPHKAQGSEWPCVVVVVPKAHAFMQHRHWLYTACTRARTACVVLGDEDGIRRAAEKVEQDKRVTLLDVWARCEGARP